MCLGHQSPGGGVLGTRELGWFNRLIPHVDDAVPGMHRGGFLPPTGGKVYTNMSSSGEIEYVQVNSLGTI